MRRHHGFTLIELMLTAAIIGILAAIAIPKFGNMILKAKEATVKAKLGAMRSALAMYYADTEGLYTYPGSPSLIPYFDDVMKATTLQIPIPGLNGAPLFRVGPFSNAAPYNYLLYDNRAHIPIPGHIFGIVWAWNSDTGEINIACSHQDSTGRIWSTW